jgi:hypothetical protein
MPRKKKLEELQDVTPTTAEDQTITARQDEQTQLQSEVAGLAESNVEPAIEDYQAPGATPAVESLIESCPRDFLTASVEVAIASTGQLFTTQAELQGVEIADTVFDAFESAFISRLEERLQPFLDVVLPQIQETSVKLVERTTARVERRKSAFDRLKQIAATVTDECRLLPPITAVGEFVSWEEIEVKEVE